MRSEWTVESGPVHRFGDDESRFTFVVSHPARRLARVVVRIKGQAMSVSQVPECVDDARWSDGRTVLEAVLAWMDWDQPPREILLHTESVHPDVLTADQTWIRVPYEPVLQPAFGR